MDRKKIRADFYDYNDGVFFVTVVTEKHRHFFGEVDDCGNMRFSKAGALLYNVIAEVGMRFPDVSVHVMQIMPNHFHAIMEVDSRKTHRLECGDHTDADAACRVPTGCLRASNHEVDPNSFYERVHHNSRLAAAVGGIKSAATKMIRKCCSTFAWQPRFIDHRIRNGVEYDMIRQYIQENPMRWINDRFNH